MTLTQLKEKQLDSFRLIWIYALTCKLTMLFLLMSSLMYIFYDTVAEIGNGSFIRGLREHPMIILLVLLIGSIPGSIILFIKTTNFGYPFGLKSVQGDFKEDIKKYILQEVPEITEVLAKQKLHPEVFNKSGIFSARYDDYEGDDWMRGIYKDSPFIMCEVHIFRYWKDRFRGLFMDCTLYKNTDDLKTAIITADEEENKADHLPQELKVVAKTHCENYDSRVKISICENRMYIMISRNRNFFEFTGRKAIHKLDEDFAIFFSEINLVKTFIEYYS
jgi:hypothetical protein